MSTFLHSYKLAISTLTPVHIGCGEDFEPTNYIIDESVLYHFDPAQVRLPEREAAQLFKLVDNGRPEEMVSGIQRFFFENRSHFLSAAHTLVPVAPGIARHYQARVGQTVQHEQNGRKVANLLEVERTSYNPHTSEPILPGSSLKGAMRTAMLDAINDRKGLIHSRENARDLEKRLLQGAFSADPLRLVKVSDTLPQSNVARQVVFCVNHKKRKVIKDGQEIRSKALSTRKEVILHGQYRILAANLTLQDLQERGNGKDFPAPTLRPTDLRSIARDCNQYYEKLLLQELDILDERRFVSDTWSSWIRRALREELRAKLDRGDVFLLRVGRYTSAEAKTLEGVRRIRIPQAKLEKDKTVISAHTVWLASNDEQARSDMLPFGWLLIEIDPVDDLISLREALAVQSRSHPDMISVRAQFAAERAAAGERLALAAREVLLTATVAADALAAERAQATQRAAMPPNERTTLELFELLDAATRQKQPGGPLFEQTFAVLNAALESGWTALERIALAEKVSPLLKEKNMLVGKSEKDFKRFLRELREVSR